MAETQEIHPDIVLEWSDWSPWKDIKIPNWGGKGGEGVYIPNKTPGVYEVRYVDSSERLAIGETTNLRFRIRQALVKGKGPHSAGREIRSNEDTSRIVVRWAVTDKHKEVEAALKGMHVMTFGRFPKYTKE
jgi:hypothetical protein